MAQTLQIRNVPEELHALIAQRARAQGLTISQYLLRRIAEIEGKPTNREVLESLRERTRGMKHARPGVATAIMREQRGPLDGDGG